MTDLPDEVLAEAERLTRLSRRATDDGEADACRRNRDRLLDEYGYRARIRRGDRDVLVCHPAEWLDDDGTVRLDRIEDTDRAAEVPLEGPDDADDWDRVDRHNRAIVEQVRERYGDDHAANADAFADFMGNHYAKRVEEATAEEVEQFLTEYYRRNVWPTDEQTTIVDQSVSHVFETAGIDGPR